MSIILWFCGPSQYYKCFLIKKYTEFKKKTLKTCFIEYKKILNNYAVNNRLKTSKLTFW